MAQDSNQDDFEHTNASVPSRLNSSESHTSGSGSGTANENSARSAGALTQSPSSDDTQVLSASFGRERVDETLKRRFTAAAIVTLSLVLAIGLTEMAAWALGIRMLKRPIDEPALQSAAAIHFSLLSSAIILLCTGAPRAWKVWLARAMTLIVAVAGIATFIEHTCQLFWDDIVLWEPSDARGLTFPGPLLPHESAAFVILALGVMFLKSGKRSCPSQLAACLIFVPNFVVLCFYMLGQSHLCIYAGCVRLSPISCLVFLMLSAGLFFVLPDRGAARGFVLRSTAGMLARRSLVASGVVFSLLLPRQWFLAHDVGSPMDINICTALIAFVAIGVFAWWCLPQVETEETKTIEVLEQQEQTIERKKQIIEQKEQEIKALQSDVQSKLPGRVKLVCLNCAAEFSDSGLKNCPDDNSTLVRVSEGLADGTLLDGRYQILRELGSGGMSTVYLARHELIGKVFAVKVLPMQYANNLKLLQRFQREAQAASKLSHPNLVEVSDFNITDAGQAYMVMEFLQGSNVSDFVRENGPIPWQDAVPLFLQICEGVNHAHANGVIHRDLKPANIMLVPQEGKQSPLVKIVDFGFAKLGEDVEQQLTRTGDVFGSPLYMSPEQCGGQTMDKRSDLYAFGGIMHFCLTEEPPFRGTTVSATLFKHVHEQLRPLPQVFGVPAWLEQIVQKLMAKDPAARYQSAVDVIVALNVGLATMNIRAATPE